MRFAFVTSEFPTKGTPGGGLSTYVARMARQLTLAGQEVEVFVSHQSQTARLEYNGYNVSHVGPRRRFGVPERLAILAGMDVYRAGRQMRDQAHTLADAVEAAHARQAFDVVHCADYLGVGRFVPLRQDRLLAVRCSSAADLYIACDGWSGLIDQLRQRLEEESIWRADLAFAPSSFVADHYARKLGRSISVIRPPAFVETEPLVPPPDWLPPRYLLHFASRFMSRKGSDLVVRGLQLALEQEPGLRMVWAGLMSYEEARDLFAPLGVQAHCVLMLHPQPKAVLYAMIRQAICAVLPSRVDNLPNTVIESLLLGTPVIGSDASSIEELVEPGVTGMLVPNGSVEALAEAMVQAWRGAFGAGGAPRFDWPATALGAALTPEAALASYLGEIEAALSRKRAGGTA